MERKRVKSHGGAKFKIRMNLFLVGVGAICPF